MTESNKAKPHVRLIFIDKTCSSFLDYVFRSSNCMYLSVLVGVSMWLWNQDNSSVSTIRSPKGSMVKCSTIKEVNDSRMQQRFRRLLCLHFLNTFIPLNSYYLDLYRISYSVFAFHLETCMHWIHHQTLSTLRFHSSHVCTEPFISYRRSLWYA